MNRLPDSDDLTNGNARLGAGSVVQRLAVVGFRYRPDAQHAQLGDRCIVRSLSIIYGGVVMGDDVHVGHHVLIREGTIIGSRVVIGSGTIIDGNASIGSFVKLESNVYLTPHTQIGDRVFIGPGAVLTDDRYPLRQRASYRSEGPTLENDVTIGGNATIVPGVTIGCGSFIAAGAVVTRDVPPWKLVRGVPGRIEDLPQHLMEENRAKNW